MIRDFKLQSHHIISKKPEYEIEWLYLMQHYGLPTRLIDWTESFLVALYFAIFDYKNTRDAAIWILNPWDLNEVFFQQISIPTASHPDLKLYHLNDPSTLERDVQALYPIAIRPIKNSSRIIAQKGAFTIHGSNHNPLNEIIVNENSRLKADICLEKIIIDGNSKLKLLKELYYAGISYSVLFPEIQGICTDLKIRYSDDFITKISKEGMFEFKPQLVQEYK
jgi:hypothetical protein